MSQAVKTIEQADQPHTLFCEICGRDAQTLTSIPDLYSAPLMACTTCVLKDCEAA